jgi:hypothetical protein
MEQLNNILPDILIPLAIIIGFWPGAKWSLGKLMYNIIVERIVIQGYDSQSLTKKQKNALRIIKFLWVVWPFWVALIILPISLIRLLLCLIGFNIC